MDYFHFLLRFFLLLFPAVCPQANLSDRQANTTIHCKPITAFEIADSSRSRFGALEFRGGLVLTSSNPLFGGISALRIQLDGAHFIALSDQGAWLRGRIAYEGNRPAGILDASMAPILDAAGKPAPQWDTESIAEDGATLYVGIEGINSIVRYNYGEKGFLAHGEPIAVPPGVKNLPKNLGLEALEFVPRKYRLGGTLIAISERGLNAAGDIKAFLIGGPSPGSFAVKRIDGYDISDAALLPGGDLLILERHYSLQRGVAMRIRRIPLADIRPGAVVDGPALIEADIHYQIDNMEALSVNRAPAGEIVLTLISDDNFSPIQRTILLQFAMKEN